MLLMDDGTEARGRKIPALAPCHLASTFVGNKDNTEARRHVVTAMTAGDDDGRALMVALASTWFLKMSKRASRPD